MKLVVLKTNLKRGLSESSPIKWIAVTIGLLIIPSHLVWKPYFVMSIPLAVLALRQSVQRKSWRSWALVVVLFIGINLTGFDFVGHELGAHLEAGSILLVMHLVLLGMVLLA